MTISSRQWKLASVLVCAFAIILFAREANADAAGEKVKKAEKKKIEMPKLPAGCNPIWDLKKVEEKCIVKKGGINDKGLVYFLVELKEDSPRLGNYRVDFIDKDGGKFEATSSSFEPPQGKKGDLVRLTMNGRIPENNRDIWMKAAKVMYSE